MRCKRPALKKVQLHCDCRLPEDGKEPMAYCEGSLVGSYPESLGTRLTVMAAGGGFTRVANKFTNRAGFVITASSTFIQDYIIFH